MSKEDMIWARELIKQKKFDEARTVLRATNHPQAASWLEKLDEIDPPAADLEATLIDAKPPADETTPPPPSPAAHRPQVKKEESKIPMPLAIGCIGLFILAGVCVVGAFLVYSNLRETLLSAPDTFFDTEPLLAPESFPDPNPISFGSPVSSALSSRNNFEESWIFDASEGDRVVITMRSDDIDSLLFLYSADGNYLTEDDDSGGGGTGYDAQISYTIPSNGQYVIVANQWFEGDGGGSYTLVVERQ